MMAAYVKSLPQIIQGGMGIGVSGWRLARAVSQAGQLGVVSGTSIAVILARKLQDGDPGGHMHRALAQFPVPDISRRILERYYQPKGRAAQEPYKPVPMYTPKPDLFLEQLTIAANFVEVWLAREGHEGLVGINYLEKIQLPHLASLYGALLAGVDYVIMGAGIPRQIPEVIDGLLEHKPVQYRLHLEGKQTHEAAVSFDPLKTMGAGYHPPLLRRPAFLPIVSSATLAVALARKATSPIDGFVVEGPLAGGHNAPPRNARVRNTRGEPVYANEDEADFARIKALGLPFWIAGSWADADKLREARALGAAGVQVGTAFAFCDESGMDEHLKRQILQSVLEGTADVFTDPRASPAGFPFKVVRAKETLSEDPTYAERPRLCDIGLLRAAYEDETGGLGFRCPAEPEAVYAAKGGEAGACDGRKCICNGLLATVGLAQRRPTGYVEAPIVTAGDDLQRLGRFLKAGSTHYSARDVINSLLGAHQPA